MIENYFERDLSEQVRLARRNGVKDFLWKVPQINGNERMLLRKMSRVLYESNVENAYHHWLRIKPQTEAQKSALSIPVDTFSEIHNLTQTYLSGEGSQENLKKMIRDYREETSIRGPGYKWNDEHQKSQRESRSLARLNDSGIRIGIPLESLSVLAAYNQKRPEVSLIESAKNERIATINGFGGSLMTLVIHDSFDHFYMANHFRDSGIEDKYTNFFDSVGNPTKTDLFSREGELIASPAYAYRLWGMVERGVEPTITADRAHRLIQKSQQYTQNQLDAMHHLEQVKTDPQQARKYGYIITSVIIELLEQRRKQGFIRKLNKEHNIIDNLPISDPEYLSFTVAVIRKLSEIEPHAFKAVSNNAILIEEYFRFISTPDFKPQKQEELPPNLQNRIVLNKKNDMPTLVLKMSDMEDNSISEKSTLPVNVRDWIIKNPGFTATQQPLD